MEALHELVARPGRSRAADGVPVSSTPASRWASCRSHNQKIQAARNIANGARRDRPDDVPRQRRAIEDTVAALVELLVAVPALEPMIALRYRDNTTVDSLTGRHAVIAQSIAKLVIHDHCGCTWDRANPT